MTMADLLPDAIRVHDDEMCLPGTHQRPVTIAGNQELLRRLKFQKG